MTPPPPPPPPLPAGYVVGFVVLDFELPDRPPLGHAEAFEAALAVLTFVQEEFYDQLDANGEGGFRAELALCIAPVDAAGSLGPACYWAIVNGMRPAPR